MPGTRYKIWSVGPAVGQGVTGSIHVGVAGIAKRASARLPFIIANELICSHLARALLLPVPTGFLIDRDGVPYYVALNFNLAGEDLPPVDARLLVENQPRISAGITVFDAWIVNGDRHRSNLAYETVSSRIQIFDHSHAFFHGNDALSARSRLEAMRGSLGIGGHCLATQLTTLDDIPEWIQRISLVPEFYIQEVLYAAAEVGLPNDSVDFCRDFLLSRRDNLHALFRDSPASFPRVEPGLWNAFAERGV